MKKVRFKDLSHPEQVLVIAAEAARKNAYVPYSKYKVGAALIADNGKIYSGCNVENAVYKVPHAEENAIQAMADDGGREIIVLCCVAENGGIPCGSCRQFIWEFCDNNSSVKIMGVDSKRNVHITTIGELLPYPFGPKNLGVNPKKH